MKKTFLGLGLFLALVFTGCSQKSTVTTTTVETPVVATPSSSSVDAESASQKLSNLINKVESEMGTVYFNFNKFDIREDMRAVVARDAEILKQSDASGLTVKIEGNCDEWGSDEYNYALGLKRAKAIKDAFIAHGVAENRIIIVSFGKSNPVCTEQTPACWAKNRRTNFVLLP